METLILDFEGTVADTSEAIYACVASTLKYLGLPASKENAVRQVIGLPLKDTFVVAGGISDMETVQNV